VTTAFSLAYGTLKERANVRLARILVNGLDIEQAERWTADDYAVQAATIGDIVSGAQRIVGNLIAVDLARKFDSPVAPLGPDIGNRDNGIPKDIEYFRPFVQISKARADGKDIPQALQSGLARLNALTDTDLQMAKVRQAQISLRAAGARTYRRVTTSEDPCDLCEIAATQIYYTDQLMPIHPRCSCDVVPDNTDDDQEEADRSFDGLSGPERDNTKELDEKDAPAKDFRDLLAVRQHGEVGPMLTWKDQNFLGPEDLPKSGLTYGPTRFGKSSTEASKQRQLAMMQKQLRGAIEKGGSRDFSRMTSLDEREKTIARAKRMVEDARIAAPAYARQLKNLPRNGVQGTGKS
jgi:hypothetical protein